MTVRLVFEQLDSETHCVDADWNIDVDDFSFLEDVLEAELPHQGEALIFDLSAEQFIMIARHYHLSIQDNKSLGRLRTRSRMDELPYKTHTHRELKLMLSGEKPMSVFANRYPSVDETKLVCDQPFDKWVDCGRIAKYEETVFDAGDPNRGITYLIYTLPQESWRARAYVLLKKAGAGSGWSVGMERMEGMLLGYTDSEIDIYIQTMFHKSN